MPRFADLFPSHESYWAHTPKKEGQKVEKLQEHIDKVNEYARRLCKAHSLDEVFDRLINDLIQDNENFKHQTEVANYLKGLFIRTIVFHDYGKINPNFQRVRMQNDLFNNDPTIKIDSQHSKLSAFVYIHYHLKEINETQALNDQEKTFLCTWTFLFANPILKHHASYIEHEIAFEEDTFKSLNRFLLLFKAEFPDGWNYYKNLNTNSAFNGLLNFFDTYLKDEHYFNVVTLLRLNFSLLTASDYYATNSYLTGIDISNFGLISNDLRAKITNSFRSVKSYNESLFRNFHYFANLSFDKLNERNSNNLNLLRQKLTAQAILSIKQHKKNRLFYLEAPTGSGKTNVSLATAIELLEADRSINKILYVFPFNTLITQTFQTIKDTLRLTNDEIIQLHSKSGFHEREVDDEVDASYGKDKLNFINNQFVNYPICLLSHIKFFDILKSNRKENCYLLHRLPNSVIIIDELQSFNPKHWDKIAYVLAAFAELFNLRLILMSATLPKIDELAVSGGNQFVRLIPDKINFFLNPNFKDRVKFDLTLLQWKTKEREEYLVDLKDFVLDKAKERDSNQDGSVRIIIEFIKKKSAAEFHQIVSESEAFAGYEIFLISGEILEPMRRHILDQIKSNHSRKVILVSTQVVEAGVDIDMDLGFKDKALLDSDEQLAGRVNRNAGKHDCKVYIFDLDRESDIYSKDARYKIMKSQISEVEYEQILLTKSFDRLYDRVMEKINKDNSSDYVVRNLPDYLSNFKKLNLGKINKEFRMIEEDTASVFVPLSIPIEDISDEDRRVLEQFNLMNDVNFIDGEEVWETYLKILEQTSDFMDKQIQIKKFNAVISNFIFSVYQNQLNELKEFCDISISEKVGIWYLLRWDKIYSYTQGLKRNALNTDVFL